MKESKKLFLAAVAYSLAFSTVVADRPIAASSKVTGFTDIPPNSQYVEALASLVQQRIVFGYSDGTYRPSENLKRGQAAVLLARALQLDLENVEDPGFQDIKKNSNYYKSIAALVKAGLFQGYSDGTFKPEQPITRAQLAKILVVAYQLPEEELDINPFQDINIMKWYAPYVRTLVKNQITTGTTPTTFSPNDPVKRGQMALFIYRCQQMEQQRVEKVIESEVLNINEDSIQLGGETYSLTAEQRKWLTPENFPALKNAKMRVRVVGNTISKIESIMLRIDQNSIEDKNKVDLVLNGNGAAIDAKIFIEGGNLSLKNITLTKDLIISSTGENRIYVDDVRIMGATILSKPTGNADLATKSDAFNTEIRFHNSGIQSMKVDADGFSIKLTGDTSIQEVKFSANSSIESDEGIIIPKIIMDSKHLINVTMNVVVRSLYLGNMNSRITLENNAKVENVYIASESAVKRLFLNYEKNKHKILRINGRPNIEISLPVDSIVDNGEEGNYVPPESTENTRLQAAKAAVAALFSDGNKTALQEGVDQAAIDAAKEKVDKVSNGTEKISLLADLQKAQDFLTAIVEAAEQLRLATEAVNNLFVDSSKTKLKENVSQSDIDAAWEKVKQLAEGADKASLEEAIAIAQRLLGQLSIPPALNAEASNPKTVQISFIEDAKWRGKITGVYKNGESSPIHHTQVNTSIPGIIMIDLTGTDLSPGLHEFIVKAEGYADAKVTFEVTAPLTPPKLAGTAPNSETVHVTFTDDAEWRGKIIGVYSEGDESPIHPARVRTIEGLITIDLTDTPLSPGIQKIIVKAEGYADALVLIEVPMPIEPPTLSGIAPNSETVNITFSDNPEWRGKITGVYMDGISPIHLSRVKTTEGMITINLTDAPMSPGEHKIVVKAEGYADAEVIIEVPMPIEPPTLSGIAPNSETVKITFTDNPEWRGKISGVYQEGSTSPIHSSRVNLTTEGLIMIDLSGAPYRPGVHKIVVKAEGYADAVVTFEIPMPLVTPSLVGTATNQETVNITFTDNPVWRGKITGVYKEGSTSPIHSSRVNLTTEGLITIDLTGAPYSPGIQKIIVKAEGYADAEVTFEVPVPLVSPSLVGTATNQETVNITFTDNPVWRGKITGVYKEGSTSPIHSSRVNLTTEGLITIDLTGAPYSPGIQKIIVKAEGYADAVVVFEVPAPIEPPTLSGIAPNPETVHITFNEDPTWRDKIIGVYKDGNSIPIHPSRVITTIEGFITIDLTEDALNPGAHEFTVKADGYDDASVIILISLD